MSKQHDENDNSQDHDYRRELRKLQIELVKLQRQLIADGARVLIIIEGRDAAGKDGTIKRLTEHMSPRETRVFAPGIPSSREASEWYFQRFVPHLPAARDFVVFNRSWYNRAGVERVMGFCTEKQVEAFYDSVVPYECLLDRDGIAVRKYYLEISKDEQKKRLEQRHKDPLKQWKISPVDEAASRKWKDYSKARDEMFERSSHPAVPWRIVRANVKKTARLELLRDLLASFPYSGKRKKLVDPDRSIVFEWSREKQELISP